MKRYMEDFNNYFDDNAGDVVIFSNNDNGYIRQFTFSASEVLSVMDPTGYDSEFNAWLKRYSGVMND
jgi:hypothetical protein